MALTHASTADSRLQSNERLEFLGDAVLGLVVCEHLFTSFPELQEGEMTLRHKGGEGCCTGAGRRAGTSTWK